ncbi:hypothetical protein EHQ58_11680 [Leptospira ognonensis]|uniref:Uncharacterized protein n=1 Tax=Leptospira ognonensis TaxID=2484945 RepID=A0A4R9K1R0_9LEPT|nr:hypothetical protein [Leptospira ognonensis]TGL58045.1 hypothetical protein EHQ58_11680 [Leptospira ognonensis]
MYRFSSIFILFAITTLNATSIWIAEGLPYAKEAKECYVNLQSASFVGQLSRSVAEFADKEIAEYATDSTNARLGSVICLRKFLNTKDDREELARSFENSAFRESHLSRIERKILLNSDREFHLTPVEAKLVEEYYATRIALVSEIRERTIAAIQMEDEEWKDEAKNFREELKARYGALLRERERFLFSLSVESRASYLTYLKQFTEK